MIKRLVIPTCVVLILTTGAARANNLIIGSSPFDPARSTFEKYDDTGRRLLTGNLQIPRAQHTATLLKTGNILVAGGTDDTTSWQIFNQNGQVLSSGFLSDSRFGHSATLLANGNVFLAGGSGSPGTWEIRSQTGALVAAGGLNGSRTVGLSAVTLANGNVWISGSALGNGDACTWEIHTNAGKIVASGSLFSCFPGGQVQVLKNKNVMLLGGDSAPGTYEIRTQTGGFVATGDLLNGFNSGASSVLLANGNVFIFGSCQTNNCAVGGAPATWEIRTGSGSFVATGSLLDSRDTAGAALLSNGNVFITGGNVASSAWEIRSSTGALVAEGSLFDTRNGGHTLTHF